MAVTQTQKGGKDFLLKIGNNFSGAVTFTDTGDLVGATAHGLVDGDIVRFSAISGTTGIVVDTNYYVVNANVDDFQVAATLGGTPLALTTNGTGTAEETFQTVGGLRSTSLSINAEEIDITNQDSAQWKEILDGAGIKSFTISGSGVFVDDARATKVRTVALAQQLRNWRILVNADGDYYQGCMKITSLEHAGDYNNEQTYSISLAGTNAITYTTV